MDILSDYWWAIAIWAGIIAFGVYPAFYKHMILPGQPIEKQADYAEAAWRQERRDDGLSIEEITIEKHIREALAIIQEEVSEAIYRNDGDIDEQTREIATRQIMLRKALNRQAGHLLHNLLKESDAAELMYPDALHELTRQYRTGERSRPSGWTPLRTASGRSPTPEEAQRQAQIKLSAFTVRKTLH